MLFKTRIKYSTDRGSGHVHATVDVDGLAGDIAASIGSQKSDHRGDLLGLTQATQRDAGQQGITL